MLSKVKMTSAAGNTDYSELVQQFCSVTGADEITGLHLIEACGGDVAMAIGMHMDTIGTAAAVSDVEQSDHQGASASATRSSFSDSSNSSEVNSVRDPIPQNNEVLVEHSFVFGRQNRRRKANSIFDAFRDFQAETEQLSVNGRAGTSKHRTLEDLFRPPLDLLHKGSFKSACDAGRAANKWLMVNVQNVQEFSCQVLNRDVWSNSTVKRVVREHFVLWQVYSDSEEGRKYSQYYGIDGWPYVAVLDPRTGEKFVDWNKLDASSFCELAAEFLSIHPAPEEEVGDTPPRKKRNKESSEESELRAALAASITDTHFKPVCYDLSDSDSNDADVLEIPDDEEPADCSSSRTAVVPDEADNHKKSSRENSLVSDSKKLSPETAWCENSVDCGNCVGGLHEATEVESLVSDEDPQVCTTEQTTSSWKDFFGSESDPTSSIVLRLPDGSRTTLSLPCSSKLQALFSYVVECGYSTEQFELVTTFPRRNISQLDPMSTLRDCSLFPQDTVFVQERSV